MKQITEQEPDIITKSELARRLSLNSPRVVDSLVKRKVLSCYRIGHRTVRFSWIKAQEELARLELKSRTTK